jgi:hypothetical protein
VPASTNSSITCGRVLLQLLYKSLAKVQEGLLPPSPGS